MATSPDLGAEADRPLWCRLAPATVRLWREAAVVGAVVGTVVWVAAAEVFVAGSRFGDHTRTVSAAGCGVLIAGCGLLVSTAPRRRASWRYRIREGRLEVRSGALWSRSRLIDLDRITSISTSAGPRRRRLGLVRVVVRCGGSLDQLVIPGVEPHAVALLHEGVGLV